MFFGRTRLVYENAAFHGWAPGPKDSILSQIYDWLNGINFQAALSVVFARMFFIDFLWVHLFLVPILWGVFTPIAAYLITHALTQNEKISVLASLLISAFPYATYFGAISVPNSLGYIFFFFTLYFMLRYLTSHDSKITVLVVVFSFFSFISHYLAGVVAFSLLFFSVAFKLYISEKPPPLIAKISLVTSFILGISLLPFSFIYLRIFRFVPTAFTLDKFYESSVEEIVGLFFLGEVIHVFDLKIILLLVIGPTLALLCGIYLLFKSRRNRDVEFREYVLFLFMAFLMMLIDYRILKLFMKGLPINEERLWVFRDFIAVPFVALAIYSMVSKLESFLKATQLPTLSVSGLKALSKRSILRVLSLLFTLNVLIPAVIGGWVSVSLSAAYPQIAPLQTTWYELEAVKEIDRQTNETYVVIGDVWTIYAGEIIVGITNPRAYYFSESNKTGHDLFVNMTQDPSPQWMLLAMNYTNTTVAYFIVSEPRLDTQRFNNVVTRALENKQLTLVSVPGVSPEKLQVFSYRKE
jgi:hypothetical protein